MGLLQHFVLIWICGLIFLILLCLKLENQVSADWFIVFIALFVIDVVEFLFLITKFIRGVRDGLEDSRSRKQNLWHLFTVVCLTTFKILVCLKLTNQIQGLRLMFIFIPIWLLLTGFAVETFWFQIRLVQWHHRQCNNY